MCALREMAELRINRFIFEDEPIDSKYTVFKICVKFHYEHKMLYVLKLSAGKELRILSNM